MVREKPTMSAQPENAESRLTKAEALQVFVSGVRLLQDKGFIVKGRNVENGWLLLIEGVTVIESTAHLSTEK